MIVRSVFGPVILSVCCAATIVENASATKTAAKGVVELVRASSVHSDAYRPAYALDGDLHTRWASRGFHGQPEWLQIDFGRLVSWETVVIHWEAAYAVEYRVEVSDDGRTWQTLREIREGRGGREALTELHAAGRYLRLVCLKAGAHGLFSVWEVQFPDREASEAIAQANRQAAEARRLADLEGKKRLANLVTQQGVQEIVFALRQPGKDGHWYANFGYYATDENRLTYGNGGKLCRLTLSTEKLTTILEDKEGGIRDPVVHYDAQKILFSYRKGGTPYYHLYEIGIDGRGLRQLTDGPYDDIEPCYLPDNGIVFVSSRCKRWVNCWLTKVAVMHRCDADGSNIRDISANLEHDNTPWPLPDGRLLYQRWEYVDRSQVDYHHLWTTNPDGTGQMVYYGNQRPGTVMIDAKPIPQTSKVVAIFSPGHGQREHDGALTVVDPSKGPDDHGSARPVTAEATYRDPWAFSEDLFLAAQGRRIVLLDGRGHAYDVYRTSAQEAAAGLECHEPRPLVARPRERLIADRTMASRSMHTNDKCSASGSRSALPTQEPTPRWAMGRSAVTSPMAW
jgi:hypothetical protein